MQPLLPSSSTAAAGLLQISLLFVKADLRGQGM
jgi:hypothetical protein